EVAVVPNQPPIEPLAVLSNKRFYVFIDGAWLQPKQPAGTPLRDYASIAPVFAANGESTNSIIAVGVAPDNELYLLNLDKTPAEIKEHFEDQSINTGLNFDDGESSPVPVDGIRRAAIQPEPDHLYIVAVAKGRDELVAIDFDMRTARAKAKDAPLRDQAKAIGTHVAFTRVTQSPTFYVGARNQDDTIA